MKTKLDQLELNFQRIVPSRASSENVSLLFLHDALGSLRQWKSFPSNLCNVLALNGIAYEREGYFASGPPPTKRSESYLHDYALIELPKFIEQTFPPDHKLILIGHSDGGSIAMLYAHKYPERVAGIVSMAAHVINETITIDGINTTITAYEQGKLKGLTHYHGKNTEAVFYAWADIWRSTKFRDWNICNDVGGSSPILILQGEDDQYGTVRQLELIEEVFPNSITCILPNCKHHPHLEHEEIVINKIQSWLAVASL